MPRAKKKKGRRVAPPSGGRKTGKSAGNAEDAQVPHVVAGRVDLGLVAAGDPVAVVPAVAELALVGDLAAVAVGAEAAVQLDLHRAAAQLAAHFGGDRGLERAL